MLDRKQKALTNSLLIAAVSRNINKAEHLKLYNHTIEEMITH